MASVFGRLRGFIRRFPRRFRKRGLQFTVSLSFTFAAVVGIVGTGLLLFFHFSQNTERLTAENNRRLVAQVGTSLDGYLHAMMRISDSMYYGVIKNADLTKDALTDGMNLLFETQHESITGIAVFDHYGDALAATPFSVLKPGLDARTQAWFVRAADRIENLHFSTPHVQNLFVDPSHTYRWVVSLSRSVDLTYGGATSQGVLLVDMNFSGIAQIFKSVNLSEHGYVYLADQSGEIIYHPRQQLVYSGLVKENNAAEVRLEDGSHKIDFEGKPRLVTVQTVGYTGWKLIGVAPMSDFVQNQRQFIVLLAIILLCTALGIVFINQYLSFRLTAPIRALERSVRDIERGDLGALVEIGGSYEVRRLGLTIRSMAAQLRRLMDDIVAEQEAKRKTEFDVLQSQINPHFLYNTLDSIVWMVENGRYEGAVVMVTALARFFRISLSRGQTVISVRDELEHARNYLTIQSIRFKNKFTYSVAGEDAALNCATVKLIVQPLVENAIYHGMEFMDGDGEISVQAYLRDGDLYIEVCDNGMGMPPEQVAALLSGETTAVETKGSGVGVRNVMQRIQLYFGEPYGLTIESEPDVGTVARARLPTSPYKNRGEARL